MTEKDFTQKVDDLKKNFSLLNSQEKLYQEIMAWGKKVPSFDASWKLEKNLVPGCQSLLYLHSEFLDGKIYFYSYSEALISAGLASLLVHVYSSQEPEVIIKKSPLFLEELGIIRSLTPNRVNGVGSLYLRMKQEALKCLLKTSIS